MSARTAVFLGQGNAPAGAAILQVGTGVTDRGVAYELFAETARVAPGGTGGEAIFTRLYVALTWSVGVTVRVTPIVDGVAEPACTVDLVLPTPSDGRRQTDVKEIGLVRHLLGRDGVTPVVAVALRGTWFAVRLETVGAIAAGDLIGEGVDVEAEVVSTSRTAENAE